MNLSDCYYLGYISRISNNSKKAVIRLDTDQPENYKKLESVLIQMHASDQSPVPFFIRRSGPLQGLDLNIELEETQLPPDISFLKGKSVFLPLTELSSLGEKAFYYHEIIGYEVLDEIFGHVGKVIDVYESAAHPVLAIDRNGQEVLIPATDQVLVKLDKSQKKIYVSAPEGLIDLYLD